MGLTNKVWSAVKGAPLYLAAGALGYMLSSTCSPPPADLPRPLSLENRVATAGIDKNGSGSDEFGLILNSNPYFATTKEMRKFANNAVKREGNDEYLKVRAIFDAVHKLGIRYCDNPEYYKLSGVKTAYEMFDDRIGSCGDISNLMNALARSQGCNTYILVAVWNYDTNFYHALIGFDYDLNKDGKPEQILVDPTNNLFNDPNILEEYTVESRIGENVSTLFENQMSYRWRREYSENLDKENKIESLKRDSLFYGAIIAAGLFGVAFLKKRK